MDDRVYEYIRMRDRFLDKYARREVGMRHFIQHLKDELYDMINDKYELSEYKKNELIESIGEMNEEELEKFYIDVLLR